MANKTAKLGCTFCDEPVAPGEQSEAFAPLPMHVECAMRSVYGGINHQKGACACNGGTSDPDPPGMTKRQAARAAAAHWCQTNVGR